MKLKYRSHHKHKCKIIKFVSSLSHRNAVTPDSLQIFEGATKMLSTKLCACVASTKNTSKLSVA